MGSSITMNHSMNKKQHYIMHGGTGRNTRNLLERIQLTFLPFSSLDSHDSHLDILTVQVSGKNLLQKFGIHVLQCCFLGIRQASGLWTVKLFKSRQSHNRKDPSDLAFNTGQCSQSTLAKLVLTF